VILYGQQSATYVPKKLKRWKRKANIAIQQGALSLGSPSFQVNWHLWLPVIWAKRQKSIDTDMCISHAYKCEYMTMILWNFNVPSFFPRKEMFLQSFYKLRFALSNLWTVFWNWPICLTGPVWVSRLATRACRPSSSHRVQNNTKDLYWNFFHCLIYFYIHPFAKFQNQKFVRQDCCRQLKCQNLNSMAKSTAAV